MTGQFCCLYVHPIQLLFDQYDINLSPEMIVCFHILYKVLVYIALSQIMDINVKNIPPILGAHIQNSKRKILDPNIKGGNNHCFLTRKNKSLKQ